jgi:hypothetical protein
VDADRVSVTGVDAREAREIDRNSNIASITVDNEIRRIREQIEHTRSRIAEHEVQRVEEIQDPSLSKIVQRGIIALRGQLLEQEFAYDNIIRQRQLNRDLEALNVISYGSAPRDVGGNREGVVPDPDPDPDAPLMTTVPLPAPPEVGNRVGIASQGAGMHRESVDQPVIPGTLGPDDSISRRGQP